MKLGDMSLRAIVRLWVIGVVVFSSWGVVLVLLLNWAERMTTEARRVQSGWIGRTTALWSTKKSRSGTREQFAKTCRQGRCMCLSA